eukprot:5914278-Alexandrium_andersonii.AAC.1
MSASLVGSEMCIRDRLFSVAGSRQLQRWPTVLRGLRVCGSQAAVAVASVCLLYTSDAADDM